MSWLTLSERQTVENTGIFDKLPHRRHAGREGNLERQHD
jgi:hypothetical protein